MRPPAPQDVGARPAPSRRSRVVALVVAATAAVLAGGSVLTATGAGHGVAAGAPDAAPLPMTRAATVTMARTAAPASSIVTGPPITPSRVRDVVPAAPAVRHPSPLAESAPARLVVPSIGVDVDVMDLGLTDDGILEVPSGAFPAGWYDGSPTPGELGPAIVAGHVSWNGTPGVFERLHELVRGDEITVVRDDGTTAVFAVTRTRQYAKDAFPTSTVYGDLDHAALRLITCGGLDADTGAYDDNVVVFARLTGTGD